jgi:hypothetical protein
MLCLYFVRPCFSNLLDAVAEQHVVMKMASSFWHETMLEYDWNRQLNLPTDHQQKSNQLHIGCAYTASLTLVDYASASDIPLSALLLTCYYVFLFKLANGETDLCVGMSVNSRYTIELQDVIGTFINM